MIRIGSAGWSYPDWGGVVYPDGVGARFDPLKYIASFLDCIEINSSFYRIPSPERASSWIRRVFDREHFMFTAKLWRGFTHESARLSAAEARDAAADYRDFLAPLHEAGRLGAVLVQFPYSFHNTSRSRTLLDELAFKFESYPLVLEFRHDSWLDEGLLASLRERDLGFCNIDQPGLSRNLPPTEHLTSGIGYVRLHGRNAPAWFDDKSGRDRRYDYLYSTGELSAWVDRIASLAAGARDVFVIANNHYRGKAVANALELKAVVEERLVEVPPDLLDAYPRLSAIAERASSKTPAAWPRQRLLPLS